MKILDIPKSGKCGQVVAFQSRFGLCLRQWVQPRNPRTPARQFMRGAFGHHSQVYSHQLSQEQLDRWHLAGAKVLSDPRLGQSGPLTGQQLYTSINSVRSRVSLPETLEVPARPTFSAHPVGSLVISNTEAGVRLQLQVTEEPQEAVMVFGQEPCSSGRRKRRNVAYLGLLPPSINGLSDITPLYTARYGEPCPGTRVFIVTCQQREGWKSLDRETNALVPNRPQGSQAIAEPASSQNPHMYKRSTRDVAGTAPSSVSQLPENAQPEISDPKAALEGTEGRLVPDEEGEAPV